MDSWKKKFRAASDEIRFLIYEINSGPVSNDVARVVIEATHSIFLLAVDTSTLQRYVMKPIELLDLCPLSTVTTLLLDDLLVSMRKKGCQKGALEGVVECKIELDERDSVALIETVMNIDDKSCFEHINTTSINVLHTPNKARPINTMPISVSHTCNNKTVNEEIPVECKIEVQSDDDVSVCHEEASQMQSRITENGLIVSEDLRYISEEEGEQGEASTDVSNNHHIVSKDECDPLKKCGLRSANGDDSDDTLEYDDRISDNDDNDSTRHDDQILENLCNVSEIISNDCNTLKENDSLKKRGISKYRCWTDDSNSCVRRKDANLKVVQKTFDISKSINNSRKRPGAFDILLSKSKKQHGCGKADDVINQDEHLTASTDTLSVLNIFLTPETFIESTTSRSTPASSEVSRSPSTAASETKRRLTQHRCQKPNGVRPIKRANRFQVSSESRVNLHSKRHHSKTGLPTTSTINLRHTPETYAEVGSEQLDQSAEIDGSLSLTSMASESELLLTYASSVRSVTPSDVIEMESDDDECKEDLPILYVRYGNSTKDRRVYDKYHYCLYCKTSSTSLRKHLFSKHQYEKHVMDILKEKKNSKQRRVLLQKVRNRGDYIHNYETIQNGKGDIITWRCPTEPVCVTDYVPCVHCYALFFKGDLWRHIKQCLLRVDRDLKPRTFHTSTSCASLLLPNTTEISTGLRNNVFPIMSQDEITNLVRNDAVIVRFGENLYQRQSHHNDFRTNISQKMREIARLIIALRTREPSIQNVKNCINPEMFPHVLGAVHQLCGLSEDAKHYSTPSLAQKLGLSLKKCAVIVKSMAVRELDDEMLKSADDFFYMCQSEWSENVSLAALISLETQKMNKPSKPRLLPLTDDINVLNSYLCSESNRLQQELEVSTTKAAWSSLVQITLAQTILFNRRRGVVAERLSVDAFNKRITGQPKSDIAESLTVVEIELCKIMSHVEIMGKLGRTMAILLTPELTKAITLMNAKREAMGISSHNRYVFARLNSIYTVQGHTCLRKCAKASGASCPAHLISRNHRKHVGLVIQILNFKEHEIDVSQFIGQDIRIDSNFYRLLINSIQLAKVSKLLLAFERGNIIPYEGKTFDEIEIDLNTVVSDESEEDDADPELVNGLSTDVIAKRKRDDLLRLRRLGIEKRRKKGPKLFDEHISSGNDDDELISEKEEKVDPVEYVHGEQPTVSPSNRSNLGASSHRKKEAPSKHLSTEKSKKGSKHVSAHQIKDGDWSPCKDDSERDVRRKSVIVKNPWTQNEQNAIDKHLGWQLVQFFVPSKSEIDKCLHAEVCLSKRKWRTVKDFCRNRIVFLKRQANKQMN